MSSYMPKGYGIGPSGKMQPIQPPAAGGGFGGMMPAPAGVAPQGGGLNPMSPGMPAPQGGGGSTDTGGLTTGPDGGGGFGQPTIYSPTFGGDTTNIDKSRNYDNSSYFHGGYRSTSNVDRSRDYSRTNIDNSQTTMGQGQRVQRQKTKTQLNPFQSISPEMEQRMIGDPSRAMAQLRIMRGN
jgi:hypothetical protein